MVILPKRLFNKIKNQLNPLFCDELSFSVIDKELRNLKYINLDKEDIPFLKYFECLEMVEISSFPSITDNDLIQILKCRSINKLVIREQNLLNNITFSKDNYISDIRIVSNDSLKSINGLEYLNNIKSFTFYDNNSYDDKSSLIDFLINNNGKVRVSVDINYYREIELECLNRNVLFNRVEWVDYIGLRNHLYSSYDRDDIKFLTNFVYDVIDKYCFKADDELTKFGILYQWMIKNVKFVNEDVMFFKHNLYKLSSIKNVFTYMEGGRLSYAKAFQFLLSCAGIKSKIIYSLRVSDSIGMYNGREVHSLFGSSDYALLKVYIDDKAYYVDIAWDSSVNNSDFYDELRLFMLDKNELSFRHRIVGESNNEKTYSLHGDDGDDLCLYAIERINNVDKLFKKIDSYDSKINGNDINIRVLENELRDLRLDDLIEYDYLLIEDEELLRNQLEDNQKIKDERNKYLRSIAKVILKNYLDIYNFDELSLIEKNDIINELLGYVNLNLYSKKIFNLLCDVI